MSQNTMQHMQATLWAPACFVQVVKLCCNAPSKRLGRPLGDETGPLSHSECRQWRPAEIHRLVLFLLRQGLLLINLCHFDCWRSATRALNRGCPARRADSSTARIRRAKSLPHTGSFNEACAPGMPNSVLCPGPRTRRLIECAYLSVCNTTRFLTFEKGNASSIGYFWLS